MGQPDSQYQGKTVDQACCACGGSIHFPTIPSLQPTYSRPSESPSNSLSPSQPLKCFDEPNWYFNSTHNLGCDSIDNLRLCEQFSQFHYNGKNTFMACCVCGGGVHESIVPSTVPSQEPSQCIDEEDWFVGGDSSFGDLTCSSIASSTYLARSKLSSSELCEAIKNEPDSMNFGKAVDEACCVCGGSAFQTTYPSSGPSFKPGSSHNPTMEQISSSQPSDCVDEPEWYWHFNNTHKLGCDYIIVNNEEDMCIRLSKIDYDGKTALEACCVCGGGFLQSRQPSDEPSLSHMPSTMPSKSSRPSEFPSAVPSSIPSESAVPSSFPSYSAGTILDINPCKFNGECKSGHCTEQNLCNVNVSRV